MKRWIISLMSILMLLGLTACASAPDETSIPGEACDLAYDMTSYGFFAEIFEEKTEAEWDAMGRYTILLQGLCTPVTVEMEGRNVQSVCAYGHREPVDIGLYQGETPMDIQSAGNAVLVNETRDYDGSTWIFTEKGCHVFRPEGDISTQIFADENGALGYRRYWGEYQTTFEQMDYAPLYLCTSRDHFLYEHGVAEIADGEVILTAQTRVTVSDVYDLDALLSQAQAEGLFAEYDTADDLLAANGKNAD